MRMTMDADTARMVAEAYDEAVAEALARSLGSDTAHREGLTAAAMFYASLAGVQDDEARSAVESLGLKTE